MRADLITGVVPVKRGQPVEVELEVVNTTSVIDHITCLLPEQSGWQIEQYPSEMTLFPGERAAVSMVIHVPETESAGEHEIVLRAQGEASGQSADQSVTFNIEPVTKPLMKVTPFIVTSGRKANFTIEAFNDGNTPITLVLHATDADSRAKVTIEPPTLTLEPGVRGSAQLTVRHRRPLTGSIETLDIQVAAECLPESISHDVIFRQKPIFPAGFITALTLAFIIALWAFAIMFGVRAALTSEAPKKTVPVSFAAGADPASLDPAVVGGDVAGTVTAETTGLPLPRITVELFNGKGERIGAGATKEDGTFALPAVLPGSYTVRYRAEGFAERWYPAATDRSGATPIRVIAATPLSDIEGSIIGLPGSLEGSVLAGDGPGTPIEITATPVDLLPGAEPISIAPQRITAGGTFRFTGLPTPATYRLRMVGAGFQPQEVQQFVPGGGNVVLNTLRLSAGDGSFSGLVVDPNGAPIGEVKVSTIVGDAPIETVTPTAGGIGQFTLAGLKSPSSYVVKFERAGFSTEVVAVRLAPGERRGGVAVVLSPAGGTVTGTVRTADGTSLGDAEIVVVGAETATTARSFTSGLIGGYRLSDLKLPGTYTLLVSKSGFRSEVVRVSLSQDAPTSIADVTLTPSLGSVSGTIKDGNGTPLGGASIEVNDGATIRTTTSASAPADKVGTFEVVDLPPGTYTVTASSRSCGCSPIVVLVEVGAGDAATANATLGVPT